VFGADYAFAPSPGFWASPRWIAALKGAGVKFVVRYISSDPANDVNGKNLLPGECDALLAAGIKVCVVVEEGAGWMLGGHTAGVNAARHADAVTEALGMPSVPVYAAADFDAAPGQQDEINACLDGMASVLGDDRGRNLYGGYYPVRRALDAGKAVRAWQTLAWSGGQWDQRAAMRQGLQVRIAGIPVDPDVSEVPDFGQWPRPAGAAPSTEPVEDDMFWLPDTPDGIPLALDDDVRRVRFYSNQDTSVHVDWTGDPSYGAADVDLDRGAASGLAPPPGCISAVVHRGDPGVLVACHYIR
jgi:Domain of unknown function (DUF1906)